MYEKRQSICHYENIQKPIILSKVTYNLSLFWNATFNLSLFCN